MKSIRYILISLIGIFLPLSFYGQVLEDITSNFNQQLLLYPQEKIYIHNDKPYYIAGETLWLRGHLVNAQLHFPDTTGRYLYVELVNPLDSVVNRIKIRKQKGIYEGYFKLGEDLAEGKYTLRSYTRYMESTPEDYFFKKTITIGDPMSATYRTTSTFRYSDDYKKLEVELSFTDLATGNRIIPENLRITDEKNRIRKAETDKEGILRYTRNVSSSTSDILFVRYDYKKRFHQQYIPIPSPDNDFDITFMPEGGNFPSGIDHRIAFKAINSSGLSEEITGTIVNDKGETLDQFSTAYKGMGYITLKAKEGDKLYAICKNQNNIEKRVELPSVNNQHLSLRTDWQKDVLHVELNKPSTFSASDYYLLVHCRGTLLYTEKWGEGRTHINFQKQSLPSGVIQLVLVDGNKNPVSERLVFNISETDRAKVNFITDKENYRKREQVNAEITLTDYQGNPLSGNFSISVTDDNDVKPDSCVNILSTLLLTSDLKGYIEDPGYYFQDPDSEKSAHLDILMMTQGWRRYNVSGILKGEYQYPSRLSETQQVISGMVKTGLLKNKTEEGIPVFLFSQIGGNLNPLGRAETKKDGHFYLGGFEGRDSTEYTVRAQTKKGKNDVVLLLDEETFPSVGQHIPLSSDFETPVQKEFEDYLEKADQKYVMENGMRMIYLKAAEVTAKRKGSSFHSVGVGKVYDTEDLIKTKAPYLLNAIAQLPGIQYERNKDGEEVILTRKHDTKTLFSKGDGSGGQVSNSTASDFPPIVSDKPIYVSMHDNPAFGIPVIVINDQPINAVLDEYGLDLVACETLKGLTSEDVEEVEIVRSGVYTTYHDKGYNNGVIFVKTKPGRMFGINKVFNIQEVMPLGYQVSKEFYSPKYTTQEQIIAVEKDLRTTIHWAPGISTSDEGKAQLQFYTSDVPTTYSVVIEGVTYDGQLIHSIEKIKRKD